MPSLEAIRALEETSAVMAIPTLLRHTDAKNPKPERDRVRRVLWFFLFANYMLPVPPLGGLQWLAVQTKSPIAKPKAPKPQSPKAPKPNLFSQTPQSFPQGEIGRRLYSRISAPGLARSNLFQKLRGAAVSVPHLPWNLRATTVQKVSAQVSLGNYTDLKPPPFLALNSILYGRPLKGPAKLGGLSLHPLWGVFLQTPLASLHPEAKAADKLLSISRTASKEQEGWEFGGLVSCAVRCFKAPSAPKVFETHSQRCVNGIERRTWHREPSKKSKGDEGGPDPGEFGEQRLAIRSFRALAGLGGERGTTWGIEF